MKDRVWPHAGDFTIQRQQGDKRTQEMFDATAGLDLEKFAAVLESLLTPRQRKWHKLKSKHAELNDDPEVKAWFEIANQRLFDAREAPYASYYPQMHEGYKSLGAFGNTCMFVDERPQGGVRYKHCHIGSVYVAEDHNRRIDTVYRCYRQSAKQAHQMWGEKTPRKVEQAMGQNPWQEFEFLHVVRPRGWADLDALSDQRMPFESVYLSVEDQEVIEVGGYEQNPYLYGRYTVHPSETYGRGPAMLVLSNIKLLQEMQKTFLRAGHKVVDPPLLLRDDGVLGSGGKSLKLRPGGLNYGGIDSNGRPAIVPLVTGAKLDMTEGMMERERQTIHDAFLITPYEMITNPQMTATQVLAILKEKGDALAPAVGRQQSEILAPQVAREFAILVRQGAIPPPPDALQEFDEYEIEYESPATQYQRGGEIVGIQRTVELAAPFLSVDPGLFLKFRPERIIQRAAEAQGAPLEVLRTDEEYQEARAEYDRAQQMRQAVEMGGGMATMAKDASAATGGQPIGQPGAPQVGPA